MSNLYQCYKGTEDRFGSKLHDWQWVEARIHELCRAFCFNRVKTPTFEYTEVFKRGVGDTTDIVQKEMFSFLDRGNRSLTLKPELTAGVARAYVQHGMQQLPQPVKLYYIEPCFRAERPQAGRDIEFYQFGTEYIGSFEPLADAEIISVGYELIHSLGLKDIALYINSIGCTDCRERYNEALKSFLGENEQRLCPTCRERAERNAMRVLDCKNPDCKKIIENAPTTLASLDEECLSHFEGVKASLDKMGIHYEVDTKLVRGLDYYTRTVFEFIPKDAGSQGTVIAGGRYDNLIESFGGKKTGAVGFGMGMGRLVDNMKKQGLIPEYSPKIDIFVASAGENESRDTQNLVYSLRKLGLSAECDTLNRSLKSQMKYADKINALYSLVIGGDELAAGKARLKNMKNGEEYDVAISAEDIQKIIAQLRD